MKVFEEVSRLLKKYQQQDTRLMVYVQSRSSCEEYEVAIRALFKQVKTYKYHAGMFDEERRLVEKEWRELDSCPKVVVTATAFGCGIDLGTIGGVVHVGRPKSLIDFIQESGRGGRDGKGCESVVLTTGSE